MGEPRGSVLFPWGHSDCYVKGAVESSEQSGLKGEKQAMRGSEVIVVGFAYHLHAIYIPPILSVSA